MRHMRSSKVARQWFHELNHRPSTPSYRCSRSDLYLLEADQDQSYASNHYPQTWNLVAEMSAGFMVGICHDGEDAWVSIDWRLCKAPR